MGYPRSHLIPPYLEVEAWMLDEGPPLHPSDDLLQFGDVHRRIQKAINLVGRLNITWSSADLVDQVHLELGTEEPALFPSTDRVMFGQCHEG